jgi:methionyl-tRNA synthetase
VFSKYLKEQVMDIIDNDKKMRHSKLAEGVEQAIQVSRHFVKFWRHVKKTAKMQKSQRLQVTYRAIRAVKYVAITTSPLSPGQEVRQQLGHLAAGHVLPRHHPVRRQLQAQVQRQLGQGERPLRRHRLVCKNFSIL